MQRKQFPDSRLLFIPKLFSPLAVCLGSRLADSVHPEKPRRSEVKQLTKKSF